MKCEVTHANAAHGHDGEGSEDSRRSDNPGETQEKDHTQNVLQAGQVHPDERSHLGYLEKQETKRVRPGKGRDSLHPSVRPSVSCDRDTQTTTVKCSARNSYPPSCLHSRTQKVTSNMKHIFNESSEFLIRQILKPQTLL